MSSSSALKASKSIVESYVSSSEKSNITTTFTDHTVSESNMNLSKKNILNVILNIVKHPKFKWAIIAILLCIAVFIYFRTQNKPKKTDKKEDTRNLVNEHLEVQKDKNGKPVIVDKKEQEYMNKITKLEQKEKDLASKINQMNTNNILNNTNQQQEAKRMEQIQQEARRMEQIQQEARRREQIQQEARRMEQIKQEELKMEQDTESSDEVFIENENVMVHNLTIDEMNAIDKQLEDININNMGYESD
jgi:hypothetical protein